MGDYSDAEVITKLSKRMGKVIDSNGIALEVEFILSSSIDEKMIPELSQAMIDGFAAYKPDPNVPTLIRRSIRHEKDDFYRENFYILNPEGYMPPDEITSKDINQLMGLLVSELTEFQKDNAKKLNQYKVAYDFFALYES
jgi:hypothetical protein